jgi:hypothetical protein
LIWKDQEKILETTAKRHKIKANECKSAVRKLKVIRNMIRQEQLFVKEKSRFQNLPTDVILGNILPYVSKQNLAILGLVSSHFHQLLFSLESYSLWNTEKSYFHLCIDTYCTSCYSKSKKGTHNGLSDFLKKFPIFRLKFHCFVADLPAALLALSSRKNLKILDLTLTNKTSSPPLEDILKSSVYAPLFQNNENNTLAKDHDNEDINGNQRIENGLENSSIIRQNQLFPDLKELILDSSHIQHINLAGRAELLDVLGANLESLTFAGLSPKGIIHTYI